MRGGDVSISWGLLLGLSVAVTSLVGCGQAGLDSSEFEAEETTAPLVNGSSDLTNYPNEKLRTVRFNNKNVANCSATVLRPTVVLTAAHCVMTTASVQGNSQTPSKLSVNGVQAVDLEVAAGWVDAAVVFFPSPVVNQWEDFTSIDPYPSSRHVGLDELLTGYGDDENGNSGTLRIGTVTPYEIDHWNYPPSGGQVIGTLAENTTDGTCVARGDSGGPRWGESVIYPRPVAGVNSLGDATPFGISAFAQAADFRYQFRSAIYAKAPDPGINLGFDSASELDTNFQALQNASGTIADWRVVDGALVQYANAPQAFQIQRGTFENFVAQMYVKSSDDDTIGIAFRYVDRNNHYRCEANRAERRLRIIRRRDGVETLLTSAVWTNTFDGVMTASSTEKRHTCSFGNDSVSVTSNYFPIGKVAIYNHFNKGAKILWYGSAQLEPQPGTW